MGWKTYRLVFRLLSPLHVGYHKVGNIQRTRYYLPGRNLWAATTERLTRSGATLPDGLDQGNYQAIGEWVAQNLAFSYFFPTIDRGEPLYPRYTEDGLVYGEKGLKAGEFEYHFISSLVSTAIEHETVSAQEGSLHEVEFITPHTREIKPTYLVGYVFAQEGNDVVCTDHEVTLLEKNLFSQVLAEIQVGGERTYGFGRLRLDSERMEKAADLFGYGIIEKDERPTVTVPAGSPLLAHTVVQGVVARGEIEPLVGRETKADGHFGKSLTRARICWVPGSTVTEDNTMRIDGQGVWEKINP